MPLVERDVEFAALQGLRWLDSLDNGRNSYQLLDPEPRFCSFDVHFLSLYGTGAATMGYAGEVAAEIF